MRAAATPLSWSCITRVAFEQFLETMQELTLRNGGKEERAVLAERFDMISVPA